MRKCYKAAICHLFFLLLSCQAYASLNYCSGESQSQLLQNIDRFYVDPGTVYISPKEILLNLSGNLLPIRNLFADSEGVYVLAEEILTAKAYDGIWTCAWCGEQNNGGNYCTTCFKLRREKK